MSLSISRLNLRLIFTTAYIGWTFVIRIILYIKWVSADCKWIILYLLNLIKVIIPFKRGWRRTTVRLWIIKWVQIVIQLLHLGGLFSYHLVDGRVPWLRLLTRQWPELRVLLVLNTYNLRILNVFSLALVLRFQSKSSSLKLIRRIFSLSAIVWNHTRLSFLLQKHYPLGVICVPICFFLPWCHLLVILKLVLLLFR